MNAPVIAANPVKARNPFTRKIRAIAVGVLLLVAGVLAWALEGRVNIWRAERDDVEVAHGVVLAWWRQNHQAPDFSVFDRMGRPRALRALELLEQDRRIGITDIIWATAARWWFDSPFAESSDRFNRWISDKGGRVGMNWQVQPEEVQEFRVLATEHFVAKSPTAK
jgi:hypothetical protein